MRLGGPFGQLRLPLLEGSEGGLVGYVVAEDEYEVGAGRGGDGEVQGETEGGGRGGQGEKRWEGSRGREAREERRMEGMREGGGRGRVGVVEVVR